MNLLCYAIKWELAYGKLWMQLKQNHMVSKHFYPGPGLGGHCIPLDPYYLDWKAREYGFHTSLIEASGIINDRMPEYCVERAYKNAKVQDLKSYEWSKSSSSWCSI